MLSSCLIIWGANMWKKILAILGLVAVVIAAAIGGGVGKVVGKAIFKQSQPTQKQIDEQLYEGFKIAAEQSNQRGPVMVDANTRLDHAEAGPGARVTYHYSLPQYSSQDIDSNSLMSSLYPEVRKKTCETKETKVPLGYGGVFSFVYVGNNGVEIARFEIGKKDCGEVWSNLDTGNSSSSPNKSSAASQSHLESRSYEAIPPNAGVNINVKGLGNNGMLYVEVFNEVSDWEIANIDVVMTDADEHVALLNGQRVAPAHAESYSYKVSIFPGAKQSLKIPVTWNYQREFLPTVSASGYRIQVAR